MKKRERERVTEGERRRAGEQVVLNSVKPWPPPSKVQAEEGVMDNVNKGL